jgi:hypothetical protein
MVSFTMIISFIILILFLTLNFIMITLTISGRRYCSTPLVYLVIALWMIASISISFIALELISVIS